MKPGWKTSEWWGALLVTLFGFLMSSGLLTTDRAQRIAGFVGSVLTALGYTWKRTDLKKAEVQAALPTAVAVAVASEASKVPDVPAVP